jgi:hypothetical protein
MWKNQNPWCPESAPGGFAFALGATKVTSAAGHRHRGPVRSAPSVAGALGTHQPSWPSVAHVANSTSIGRIDFAAISLSVLTRIRIVGGHCFSLSNATSICDSLARECRTTVVQHRRQSLRVRGHIHATRRFQSRQRDQLAMGSAWTPQVWPRPTLCSQLRGL